MRYSLILLLLIAMSFQPVNAQGLKTELEISAPKQTKCFKGVELYLWHLDGKPVWTLMHGTNRLKTEQEIRNPKEAIKSFAELEKLLGKLAPGEYVFFTSTNRTSAKPATSPESKESQEVKSLCAKLGLNYSGDGAQ